MKLLTTSSSKTMKGEKKGYLTFIMYLKPSDTSGVGNVCAKATEGCKASCLNTAGRGQFNNVQAARQRKTEWYFDNRQSFFEQLNKEVALAARQAKAKGFVPAVRLNGTSDLPAMELRVANDNPQIQFYGYTAIPRAWERVTKNYHLTFSRKENNMDECLDALAHGINVAVVFDKIPKKWLGYKVINGDETDLRFLDPKRKTGVIIGLKAKGKAKNDQTGFVVRLNNELVAGRVRSKES